MLGSDLFTNTRPFFPENQELWVSDGTVQGTVVQEEIRGGVEPSSPADFTVVGKEFLFTATDDGISRQLWLSNGTDFGTFLLSDISAKAIESITKVNNDAVFFSATTNTSNIDLWFTDTLFGGTQKVANELANFDASSPFNMIPLGPDSLLVFADNSANGVEPWIIRLEQKE